MTHFTKHGTRRSGDALDLFAEETQVLGELFSQWAATEPSKREGRREAVRAKWDHGTIGKLILEHGAVRLAAAEDIARVLQAVDTRGVARQLEQEDDAVRPVLDRIYDSGRGVQPISLGLSLDFTAAVDELGELLGPALSSAGEVASGLRLASDLGEYRSQLRSADFIRKHAPGHPGAKHWGSRWAILVRLHTAFDRLRGFPWGESALGDRKLAEHFDHET